MRDQPIEMLSKPVLQARLHRRLYDAQAACRVGDAATASLFIEECQALLLAIFAIEDREQE